MRLLNPIRIRILNDEKQGEASYLLEHNGVFIDYEPEDLLVLSSYDLDDARSILNDAEIDFDIV